MVGFSALACLVAAAALRWGAPDVDPNEMAQAAFVRVGLVMAALWIALPTRTRAAAWSGITPASFGTLALAVFLTARFRQAVIPVLIAVGVVGYYLRPRGKERPRSRPAP